MIRAVLGAVLVCAVSLFVATAPAQGHAAFITSNPAPDSTIAEMPAEISVIFSQAVARSETRVTVTGPDGSIVSGDLTVADNRVSVLVSGVGPGVYTVEWVNASLDDGHEASGSFQFTLSGG